MVFSSFSFLFVAFPVFFLVYGLLDPRYRNAWLLVASLAFYYVGEGYRIAILVASICTNYAVGFAIGRYRTHDKPEISHWLLAFGILFNLGLLVYFKYTNFIISNANLASELAGLDQRLQAFDLLLPLGISFFAFQGISYLLDVYRGSIVATSSLLRFATYKAMFPQLIAGPIVRYADVANEIGDRRIAPDAMLDGIGRFIRGLAKKVLIADTLAVTADQVFSLSSSELGAGVAWLGVATYTLQIYFDFSGYSDMAIGMGRMMGFKYPENFNHPYASRSIGEFWRRWHMTLSSWFRDYVYFPLGGNRFGPQRTYLNLIAVFSLTGLWHGASWTFVLWGLWHGLFMLLERWSNPETWRIPRVMRHGYVMFVVMVGWTLFRADSSEVATRMLKAMAFAGEGGDFVWSATAFLNPIVLVAGTAGTILSLPLYKLVVGKMGSNVALASNVCIGAFLLVLCAIKVLSGSYSPFLYFRF